MQKQNLYNDSKEIIANAAELFQKAIPILKHKDVKGTNAEISRYAQPVKINGRNYNVMFTVKNIAKKSCNCKFLFINLL